MGVAAEDEEAGFDADVGVVPLDVPLVVPELVPVLEPGEFVVVPAAEVAVVPPVLEAAMVRGVVVPVVFKQVVDPPD